MKGSQPAKKSRKEFENVIVDVTVERNMKVWLDEEEFVVGCATMLGNQADHCPWSHVLRSLNAGQHQLPQLSSGQS